MTTAADVYSLGAILYELLTGRPPFRAESVMDTLMQVLEREPDRPTASTREADRDLEVIALKCLEKDPKKRYESAAALADDLSRWQRGEPIEARPTSRVERVAKWIRRRPVIAGLLALVLVSTIGGTTGVSIALVYALGAKNDLAGQLDLTKAAERKAREAEKATSEQLLKTDAALLDARTSIYVNDITRAQAALVSGELREAERSLAGTRPELRSWEFAYLEASARRRASTPPVPLVEASAVAFSPDGTRIAAAGRVSGEGANSERIALIVVDASTGKTLASLDIPFALRIGLAFHPDGRRLATASNDRLQLWDIAEARSIRSWPIEMGSAALAFSSDGMRLAAIGTDGKRTVLDAESGEIVRTFQGRTGLAMLGFNEKSLVFTPEGTRLASTYEDRTVKVWDLNDGHLVHVLKGHRNSVSRVACSPDGKRLASAASNLSRREDAGELILWDLESGNRINTFSAEGEIRSVAFAPDGQALAAIVEGSIWIWDLNGGRLIRKLSGHAYRAGALAFHPRRSPNCLRRQRPSVADLGPPGRPGLAVVEAPGYFPRDPGGIRAGRAWPRGRSRWWPNLDLERRTFGASTDLQRGLVRLRRGSAGRGRRPRWASPVVRPPDGQSPARSPEAFQQDQYHSARSRWRLRRHVLGGQERQAVRGRDRRANPGNLENAGGGHALDGREIAVIATDGRITLVNVETGRERASSSGPINSSRAVYSPDGGRLAVTVPDLKSSKSLVWDTRSGQSLGELEGKVLGFLPGGSEVVIGTIDGRIILSDLAKRRADRVFSGHEGEVLRAVVTPDGKRLLTCGRDSTIRAWDLALGRSILVLRGHSHWVVDLTLSSGGNIPASASFDGTVRIWPTVPAP